MYEIKLQDFEEALQYEQDFWDLVKSEKLRIKHVIHEMTIIYAAIGRKVAYPDKAANIPSWIEVPARVPIPTARKESLSQVEMAKNVRINLLNDEYDEVYDNVKWMRFCKYVFNKALCEKSALV